MANGSRVPINLSIAATAAGAAWIFVFEWVNLSSWSVACLPVPRSHIKVTEGGKDLFSGRTVDREKEDFDKNSDNY